MILYDEKYAYLQIDNVLKKHKVQKFFLVCGHSFDSLSLKEYIEHLDTPFVRFSDFMPNPTLESVIKATDLFDSKDCDFIIAIGGGSAIDIAKCVKLYSGMNHTRNYSEQPIISKPIPFLVVPTTAGTGSEATQFAVIYIDGEKQSISHQNLIPNYVVFEPDVLKSLPQYQKKCAMLDALCQAIESMWSVNSTQDSKQLSILAISTIFHYRESYLLGKTEGHQKMLFAANLAGQAINITQTTAAHAMSYKITSLFGIPHGHAVAICLPKVWIYLLKNISDCRDKRGSDYLQHTLLEISKAMTPSGENVTIYQGLSLFEALLVELDIDTKQNITKTQLSILVDSVNMQRLENTPIPFTHTILMKMYQEIFCNTHRI